MKQLELGKTRREKKEDNQTNKYLQAVVKDTKNNEVIKGYVFKDAQGGDLFVREYISEVSLPLLLRPLSPSLN